MKILVYILTITLIVMLPSSAFTKTDIPDGSAIPPAQWENHPEVGTAIAIQLRVATGSDNNQFNYLVVYIKNISTANSYLLCAGGHIGLIKFFYTDGQGIKHYLRDDHNSEINNGGSVPLVPGQICHDEIDLTENELAFVVSHPLQCSFVINPPPIYGKARELITSPKQLYLSQ